MIYDLKFTVCVQRQHIKKTNKKNFVFFWQIMDPTVHAVVLRIPNIHFYPIFIINMTHSIISKENLKKLDTNIWLGNFCGIK